VIREVTIRRFKRFEEVTLPLEGHVVLAGQNNSGKTTVLQALSAWSLALEQWRLLNDRHRHNGAYARKPVTRQSFNAVPLRAFDLLWSDRDYRGTIEIEVQSHDGWRLTMELIADTTEQIFVRPTRGTAPEILTRSAPRMVYVSSVDGLEIEEPAINNPDWIGTLLGRQRPGGILRNLLLEVSHGPHWEALTASIARLFGIELSVPETAGGQIICEFRSGSSPRPLDIMGAGSGFHQVLLLLACLYTRGGSVLLIDEPDAHLHVFLQDTIYAELRHVAAASQSQIIFATHSEVIFRAVPPSNLIVMMGTPRRLANAAEREQLSRAMAVLDQIDVVAALDAPGILYLEGQTDLNLLRTWAGVLQHPVADYLNRRPFWKPQVFETRDAAPGVRARDHFESLQLVRRDLTGVWLIDADGKSRIAASSMPTPAVLNRVHWERYETESYLVHPALLERFVDRMAGAAAAQSVQQFFTARFGAELAATFANAPLTPPSLIENYLRTTKARTDIVGTLLQDCGIHGFDYSRYDEIAACMLPEEIHPEVREKLDFIQRAFGL
jgi:predicted ATPase